MISDPLMRLILLEQYSIKEAVSKCFPLTAGFKIKEENLTTGIIFEE